MSAAQPSNEAQPVPPAAPPPETPPTTSAPETVPAPAPPTRWQDQYLDADLRQEPTLSRYQNVTELAKAHVEARSKLGAKGLILPGPEAPPEAWNEVYTALGRPEAPEQYDLGEWKPPEGVPWDAGFQKEALAKFHAAGLSSKQAQELLGWYTGKGLEGIQAQEAQSKQLVEQWGNQVRTKWGQAAPAKLDLANRTFDTFFPPEVHKAIVDARTPDGGPLGEHPAFLEAMAAIGQHLAEHQLLGDKEPLRHAKTPEEAQARLQQLTRDPDFRAKLTDPKHPDNATARAEWEQLHRQALLHPEASAETLVMGR